MEPVLLITLLSIGLAGFFALQAFGAKKQTSAEEKVMKGYFLLGLSGLMAKIAAADGHVTADETEMATRFFNRMELTAAEKAMCIGNFVTARRDGLSARDHSKRFMAYANGPACEFLYDMLWRISRVDGTVAPEEERLLAEIAVCLGLGEVVFANFKAGKKPLHNKAILEAAGVPPSLLALAR